MMTCRKQHRSTRPRTTPWVRLSRSRAKPQRTSWRPCVFARDCAPCELSVRTRHAHADRDLQVADNDRSITRCPIAGYHDPVRQSALPRTIGVFGLSLERRCVLDPHLWPPRQWPRRWPGPFPGRRKGFRSARIACALQQEHRLAQTFAPNPG
jgi:hypothetical protein